MNCSCGFCVEDSKCPITAAQDEGVQIWNEMVHRMNKCVELGPYNIFVVQWEKLCQHPTGLRIIGSDFYQLCRSK